MGYEKPEIFGFVGGVLKGMVEEIRSMVDWFEVEGYGSDITVFKGEVPELQDLRKRSRARGKSGKT